MIVSGRIIAAALLFAVAGVLTWYAWDTGTRWVYVPANLFTLGGLIAILGTPPSPEPEQ